MIPKFRVYDLENCEMWVANDYEDLSELFMALDTDDSMFSDPMQSTGLFDKNGVDIFDGDIVKLRYTITSDFELLKVTKSRGGSWRIGNRLRSSELWLRNEDCEVIGNIHENPELLESVEE